MLWLSIHLPRLALEVFGDGDHGPLAVVEGSHVLLGNPDAEAAGVHPGVRITAAQALCPQLVLRQRDPRAEQNTLRRLAGWGLQFTPTVALHPPQALLLEIGGSLRYFGGLTPLLAQLRAGLRALGYRHRLGIAPPPTAAWMLAVAGDEQPVLPGQSLQQRLGPLPMTLLAADPTHHEALRGLGVQTVADCLALPRAGLARRLSPELLQRLDRALGRSPDPRESYHPPGAFHSRIELPAEVTHSHRLSFALNRLLRELCGLLRGTGRGVQRLQVTLEHRRQPTTSLELGTLAPSRDPEHLLGLLRERLERFKLPAPVIAVGLSARQLQHLEQQPVPLLDSPAEHGVCQWRALLERLAARLGSPRIRGLGGRAEHRPERAWCYTPPGEGQPAGESARRPLWLLPQPQPLSVYEGRPLWQGPLVLEQGPECIETGWWDGADIRRDYYVAVNPAGSRLWIFRDHRPPRGWFLHGVFA